MAPNKYADHLVIFTEDALTRDLANGFITHHAIKDEVISFVESKGWSKTLDKFFDDKIKNLNTYPLKRILLLIDFDDKWEERAELIKRRVPSNMKDRIFFLGCADEPETLKSALGHRSAENIGHDLADACYSNCWDNGSLWQHPHLNHNADELKRLRTNVWSFIHS